MAIVSCSLNGGAGIDGVLDGFLTGKIEEHNPN